MTFLNKGPIKADRGANPSIFPSRSTTKTRGRSNNGSDCRAAPSLPFHLDLIASEFLASSQLSVSSLHLAASRGKDLARHLIRAGKIDEVAYFAQAAKRIGVTFDASPRPDRVIPVSKGCPLEELRHHSSILMKPFARSRDNAPVSDSSLLCAPSGADLDRLAARLQDDPQLRARIIMTTPSALRAAQRAAGAKEAMRTRVFHLKQAFPHLSAHGRIGSYQSAGLLIGLVVVLICALLFFPFALVLNLGLILVFLTMSTLRMLALWKLPRTRAGEAATLSGLMARSGNLTEDGWPSYSVLVPLYREGRIVPDLLRALSALDYPRDRLTCYLLLEADDDETRDALARVHVPAFVELVDVPEGGPRTKPKALNYALAFIDSDLTVIYDAEDRPHPFQLKMAALQMIAGDEKLGCLQGRLAIDNAKANFLTRQFAIEYAALFDGLLPFLADQKMVVPLGGTSNHFKTRLLKDIGGWDPYNVTEDADLGMRFCRLGYRIETLRSATWEEAPETYLAWVKQRTRWFKGWMQTWLVHMREPVRLYTQLGRTGFLSFHIMIGSMLVSSLVHPLYILTFGASIASIFLNTTGNRALFWSLFLANSINLIAGYSGAMLLGHHWSRKRYGFEWRTIAGMPLYWLLMTPAAWRALFQLMLRPHHWEKTEHGLSKIRPPVALGTSVPSLNVPNIADKATSFRQSEYFMRRDPSIPKGTLTSFFLPSDSLKSNMLGDPTEREIVVYVPKGHDGKGLPLLVDLVGFTAGGPAHTNWKNFGENVPERLDRLIANGDMPPVVVAFPDCFTRLGGNQYVNSAAMGNWEDFLINEMVPAIEARLGCGGAGKRGLFGKSSGGYGSIIHAMRHADCWSAAACLSGDMAFELCYLPDMPNILRTLAKWDFSVEAFLENFEAGPKWDGKDIHALMTLAMAATYDPDPSAFCGIRLPVNLHDCSLIPELWDNWLKWDPVLLADQDEVIDNLKSLKALWVECGHVDQYNLVYGARRLHAKLEAANVPHIYEEFADNHSSIDYRMDKCLPYLAKALCRA
ncbi:glycosyltransferase [uncultured Cohaesibacter sp.]|uniref:glycosyltransferase n=1 Tax=uncultured Cohaesibacter sp. TaxID=1002546 RepID=UPI00292F037B|nr:glycosyltransferase [uncultured Cohaesibacter sp.]